jgi:hypothetical protein
MIKRKVQPELEALWNIAKKLDGGAVTVRFIRLEPGQSLNIVVDCAFTMKDAVKECGFEWNPILKLWHYEFRENFAGEFLTRKDEQGNLFYKDEDKW